MSAKLRWHTTPAHTTPEDAPNGSGPIVTCTGMLPDVDDTIAVDEPATTRASQRADDADEAGSTAVARRERSGREHDDHSCTQVQPAVNQGVGA